MLTHAKKMHQRACDFSAIVYYTCGRYSYDYAFIEHMRTHHSDAVDAIENGVPHTYEYFARYESEP